MLYVHENNILSKIQHNYNGRAVELTDFYNKKYKPMRASVEALAFDYNHLDNIDKATDIFNQYYREVKIFASKYTIKSQSKFESTFLEEISVYLFKDLPLVKAGQYDFFNKKIYAGLKIENDTIALITKDVDFCIGKKVNISIDGKTPVPLIVPIVSVEVKTYLDATMFGEAKSSSKTLRSASPQSSAYILMGYKCLAKEHIISARQDSTFNEIFVLQASEASEFDAFVIKDYWKEIATAVEQSSDTISIPSHGRLLRPN